MSNTREERTSSTSDALLGGEHEVRYGWVRPAIEGAGTWCDLGCGRSAGSTKALAGVLPERIVLVSTDIDAVEEARRSLAPHEVEGSAIDLTLRSELDELGSVLLSGPGPVTLTCFGVIEHLSDFVPLVEWFAAMAAEGATVAISVPNDVFTSVRRPNQVTKWGSSTVEELRRLLPEDHVIAAQTALEGSVVDPIDADGSRSGTSHRDPLELVLGTAHPDEIIPMQYLVGFGPAADRLGTSALVLPIDVASRRVWERQLEADNRYYRTEAAKVSALEARITELEAELAEVRSA